MYAVDISANIGMLYTYSEPQKSSSMTVDYLLGTSGTGQQSVKYPVLNFQPNALFALGSPIGIFLSARGVQNIGEEFKLPTCARVFNIFHPVSRRFYSNFTVVL